MISTRRIFCAVSLLFLLAGCGSSNGGSDNNGSPSTLSGRKILITPSSGGSAYLAVFESSTVSLSRVLRPEGSGALSALASASFLAGGNISETVVTDAFQAGDVVTAEAVFSTGESVKVDVTLDDANDVSDVDLAVDSVAVASVFSDFIFSSPFDLKIQADGKIVVAGVASFEGEITSTGGIGHVLISRFEADGRPDTSFGDRGNVIEDFGLGGTGSARRLVLLSDGKILVGGESETSLGIRLFVARYLPDGTLDSAFGSGGVFFSSVGSSAADLQVQSDGKILVAGVNGLIRLNSGGSLDTGFGTSGVVPGPEVFVTVTDSVVLPFLGVLPLSDGKILTSATYGISANTTLFLARFLADGTLDLAFGTDGVAQAELGSGYELSGGVITRFSDLSILVGGSYKNGGLASSGFFLAKFDATGVPVGSFGTAGVISVETGEPHAGAGADFDQVIQADTLFVASFFQTASFLSANDGGTDFAVFAFTSSGTPDASFATGGRIVTDIATAAGGADRSYDASNCIDKAPDGSIVVGGNSGFGTTLVRY